MSEPHKIMDDDTRSWYDLYRENEALQQQLQQFKQGTCCSMCQGDGFIMHPDGTITCHYCNGKGRI